MRIIKILNGMEIFGFVANEKYAVEIKSTCWDNLMPLAEVFADINERAQRKEYFPDKAKFDVAQLVEKLIIIGGKISSLRGMPSFVKNLEIRDCELLSLEGCPPNLETVRIDHTQISNCYPLKNCPNLRYAELVFNDQLVDLVGLGGEHKFSPSGLVIHHNKGLANKEILITGDKKKFYNSLHKDSTGITVKVVSSEKHQEYLQQYDEKYRDLAQVYEECRER
jgi:hypothetical protein